MVGRVADAVVLGEDERRFLEGQVRRHNAPRSLSDRCRMVLLCEQGLTSKEVARHLGVNEHTVGKWRRRFVKDRIEALRQRKPTRGRRRTTLAGSSMVPESLRIIHRPEEIEARIVPGHWPLGECMHSPAS